MSIQLRSILFLANRSNRTPFWILQDVIYHISLCQILESERRLKVSDILNLFSQLPSFKQTALQNFIQSFSPEDEYHSDDIDLTPFLSELPNYLQFSSIPPLYSL